MTPSPGSIAITFDVYGHLCLGASRQAAAALEAILTGTQPPRSSGALPA